MRGAQAVPSSTPVRVVVTATSAASKELATTAATEPAEAAAAAPTEAVVVPAATATPVPAMPPTLAPAPPPTGSLAGVRIYSNGDSTSYFMSVGVLSMAVAQGAVQVQPAAEYQLSSGLLGGASFDWYGYMSSQMAAYTPDVVVFMVGANDAHVGMDLGAYAQKVGQMMDQLSGKRLIWVGQPNMGRPDLAASVPGVNQVFAQEAAKRPWVRYVDTWSLTSDANGNYMAYTPDGSLARGDDGVHFTSAGGNYLAQAVIAAILGG